MFLYFKKIKIILSVGLITINDNSCFFIVNFFRRSGSSKVLLYCWFAALFVVLSGICVCYVGQAYSLFYGWPTCLPLGSTRKFLDNSRSTDW